MNPELLLELRDTRRILAEAFERAKAVLCDDAIDMADFQDLYGHDQVARDQAEVTAAEAQFAAEDEAEEKTYRKFALIFEAIIHEQCELSDWLGPSVTTLKTSRYDDIFHGVDGICEFMREDQGFSHLAFGVDVTYSVNVDKKLRRIRRDDIEAGKLAKVKYFASPRMRLRGELSGIPRVVVGLDRHNLYDVVEQWMTGKKNSLATHPVSRVIREQILLQLRTFATYAEKIGNSDVAAIYAQHASLLEHIIAGQQPAVAPRRAYADTVDAAIKAYLVKMMARVENGK